MKTRLVTDNGTIPVQRIAQQRTRDNIMFRKSRIKLEGAAATATDYTEPIDANFDENAPAGREGCNNIRNASVCFAFFEGKAIIIRW